MATVAAVMLQVVMAVVWLRQWIVDGYVPMLPVLGALSAWTFVIAMGGFIAATATWLVGMARTTRLCRDFVSCAEQRSIALDDRGPIHDEIRDLDLFVYGIPDIPGEGPPDGDVAECATRHYYAAEELYRAQHQRPLAERKALVASGSASSTTATSTRALTCPSP